VEDSGHKWKTVVSSLQTKGIDRTISSARNRFTRIHKGLDDVKANNCTKRCTRCGDWKRGHICRALQYAEQSDLTDDDKLESTATDAQIDSSSTSSDDKIAPSPYNYEISMNNEEWSDDYAIAINAMLEIEDSEIITKNDIFTFMEEMADVDYTSILHTAESSGYYNLEYQLCESDL
jgi:hypothetical protein